MEPLVDHKEILDAVRRLQPLPEVVLRVATLAADLEIPVETLKREIHRDPVLTAKLLRLCNSPYYGCQREIASVQEAIVRLGFDTVRKLALTLAVRYHLDRPLEGYAMTRGDLWRHAVGCAIAGEHLARRWTGAPGATVYTAGLLHDLGKVVLDAYVGVRGEAIQERVEAGLSFPEAEKAALGLDHGEVGGLVAHAWGLPQALAEAMAHHHAPSRARTAPEVVAVVHLADLLCLMMGLGLGRDGLSYRPDEGALARFHLTRQSLEKLLDELPGVIGPAMALLEEPEV